jgi:predicted CXXCH cytochrome family protein
MNADGDGNEWKSPHSPVEEGECTGCHNVHGSAAIALLQAPPPELCNECHEDKRLNEYGERWLIEHPPVAGGGCLDCHAAHGGNDQPVLMKGTIEVCSECHSEPHVNHLSFDGESKKVAIPGDFPIKPDGSFVCTGCHRAHGAAEKSLWKGTQATFCTICHLY